MIWQKLKLWNNKRRYKIVKNLDGLYGIKCGKAFLDIEDPFPNWWVSKELIRKYCFTKNFDKVYKIYQWLLKSNITEDGYIEIDLKIESTLNEMKK